MKMWLGAVAALVLGCDVDDDPPDVSPPDAGPTYSVVAEGISGGALLAGFHTDGMNLYVGGDLAGGPGLIIHEGPDGPCVLDGASDRALWWAHGVSADDWYAVGDRGAILHNEAGVITDESVPTDATLYGVWHGGDRVIAVGGDVRGTQLGEIWARDDGEWHPIAADVPGVLFKIWHDWIVGVGVAYQLDGDALIERPLPANARLLTVTGRGPDDVWAVGGAGGPLMLHWDGAAWSEIEVDPFCATQPLNGVWTAPGEPVWIAGNFGSIGSFDGTAWTCPRRKPSQEHFHGVFHAGGEPRFVGGDLFHPGDNRAAIVAAGSVTPWGALQPCE